MTFVLAHAYDGLPRASPPRRRPSSACSRCASATCTTTSSARARASPSTRATRTANQTLDDAGRHADAGGGRHPRGGRVGLQHAAAGVSSISPGAATTAASPTARRQRVGRWASSCCPGTSLRYAAGMDSRRSRGCATGPRTWPTSCRRAAGAPVRRRPRADEPRGEPRALRQGLRLLRAHAARALVRVATRRARTACAPRSCSRRRRTSHSAASRPARRTRCYALHRLGRDAQRPVERQPHLGVLQVEPAAVRRLQPRHADQNSFVVNAGGQRLAIEIRLLRRLQDAALVELVQQTRRRTRSPTTAARARCSSSRTARWATAASRNTSRRRATTSSTGDASAPTAASVTKAVRSMVYLKPGLVLVYDNLASARRAHVGMEPPRAEPDERDLQRQGAHRQRRPEPVRGHARRPAVQFTQTNALPRRPPTGDAQWHGKFAKPSRWPRRSSSHCFASAAKMCLPRPHAVKASGTSP